MKRLLKLMLCGLMLTASLFAIGQSKLLTRSDARKYSTNVAYGGKIYFAKESTIDVYNESDGTWAQLTLPQPGNILRAAAVGGKIFFGRNNQIIDVYDPVAGTWAEFVLSEMRGSYAIATFGTKIMIAGGGNWVNSGHGYMASSNKVDIYDAATGLSISETMPVAGTGFGVISVGSKIIIGNLEHTNTIRGTTRTSQAGVYDTVTGTWSTTTLPENGSFFGNNVAIGDKVFFSGQGYDLINYDSPYPVRYRHDFTARFVAETNSWTDITPFADTPHYGHTVNLTLTNNFTPYGSQRSEYRAVKVSDGKVLFFGGRYGTTDLSNRVYSYDNATGKLFEGRLTTTFSQVSIAQSGNRIYLAGPEAAVSGSPTMGAVEVYSTDALDEVDILVDGLPVVGAITRCIGETVPLHVTGAASFAWAVVRGTSDLSSETGSDIVATPKLPPGVTDFEYYLIAYILTASDAEGFKLIRYLFISASKGQTPPRPDITVNTESGLSLVSSSTSGNQWFKDGTALTGATAQTLPVTDLGNYSVRVSANGCTGPMSEIFLVTGTDEISSAVSSIFPNPVSNTVNVEWAGFAKGVVIDVAVIDVVGRVVMHTTATTTECCFDVSTLRPGIYFFRARQGSSQQMFRLVRK